MKHKIAGLLLAAGLLSSLLTGCSKEESAAGSETQAEAAQTVYAYQASYLPLDAGEYEVSYINAMCVSGENLFVTAECRTGTKPAVDEITGEPYLDENGQPVEEAVTQTYLFRVDPADGSLTRAEGFAPQGLPEGQLGYTYVNGLQPGPDGSVWLTEYQNTYSYDLPEDFDAAAGDPYAYYTPGKSTMTCRRVDAQGQQLQAVTLELEPESSLSYVRVLEDGTVYAADWMNLYLYDGEGQLQKTISLDGASLYALYPLSSTQMGVLAWQESGNVLLPVDAQTGTFGEAIEIQGNAYNLVEGFGDYLYLYEYNGTFYGVRRDSGEQEKLFAWLDCDVDTSYLGARCFAPDGTAYALDVNYEKELPAFTLITLQKVDASTLPQREELILAAVWLDWDVRSEIVRFNKSQDQVRIVVKDYSEYNTDEDATAGLQKLNTEILSGVVPDLFYLNGTIPADVYGAKGIFQDLWPLIDGDGELSRDDLMTHFFEVLSVEGKLYQVTDQFAITSAVGRSDRVGTASGWTLAELQQAYAALEPGATVFGEMDTQSGILNVCIDRNVGTFVDWSTLQCSFDSQEFIDLLNFVRSFPAEFDDANYDWSLYESEGLRMRAGKQLLMYCWLYSFDDVMRNWAMTDGTANYIGFPTTGNNGSTFQLSDGLAISSTCRNTEAAWSFVRRFLTEEHQSAEYMWFFPTNRHAFEAYAQRMMTVEYRTDALEGEENRIAKSYYWFGEEDEVPIYAMEQAAYDQFLELYERCTCVSTANDAVSEIIAQEAEPFFAGQKTAEQTAKLIQDRVSLYVFEQG